MLINAFGDAASTRPRLRLFIAGVGGLRTRLEALAVARCPAGSVRFLGFVEEIAEFMAACDVLAFPTQPELGEGFGLAALEGMAAGRPVLATDVGALPEIVVDGATGFVVPPRSTEGLTRGIVALADEPALRRRLGEQAMHRAGEVLARGHGARHHHAVYTGGGVTSRTTYCGGSNSHRGQAGQVRSTRQSAIPRRCGRTGWRRRTMKPLRPKWPVCQQL